MNWLVATGGAGAIAVGVILTWLFVGRRSTWFSMSVLVVSLIVFGLAAILRGTGIL